MALNPLVDSRDVRFVLFELLNVDKLNKYSKYSDFDKETFEDTLNLAEKMAVEAFYPVNADGDKIGAQYNPETKEVKIPECYREPYKAFIESGFLASSSEPEIGGMGLPISITIACSEYFNAANTSLCMYPGLTHGASMLINSYGSDEQKKLYLEKMVSGQWSGTMCLTEAEAGSDVGNIKTKAVKQSDGTYLITGQKIFISAGDHDLTENIIHPVLARIDGDPEGTGGISIFIVPKIMVNSDGSLGDKNDVSCAGIEHKMGIKGSATCTLAFGDNGKCIGYLLGEPRKGLKVMFQMMNEARLGVGLQGLSLSSSAYMHSITYAKTRIQGSHVTKMLEPNAPKVPIIQHPDVKRMLLWMKSYVEGMRTFTYYLSNCIDLSETLEGDEAKEYHGIVELLTPICKAGNSDLSWLVTSEAIQVYGGYGFISDYPVEQLARDSKIQSLYEGTNAIQSMDLTMRKILMNPEMYNYNVWKKKVNETIKTASGIVDEKYITPIKKGLEKFDEVLTMMKGQLDAGKFLHLFMNATNLGKAMFDLVLAWCHLWNLTLTIPKMKELVGDAKGADRGKILKENNEAAFYCGKVLSSQFFIATELPKFFGKIDAILCGETSVIKATDEIFTGAIEE